MFFRSKEPRMIGDSNVLVVALLGDPIDREIWIWDLVARVRPQLCELIAMTDTRLPCPDFDKALVRGFKLQEAMAGRERVVLVASAPDEEMHSEIVRWHIRPEGVASYTPPLDWAVSSDPLHIAPVKQHVPRTPKGKTPLLPYWLEEQMPVEGLDFIHLPRPRVGRGHAATGRHEETPAAWADRSRLATPEFIGPHAASLRLACSALLGTLWEIVREVESPALREERAA
ncbi:MAG: hypothetical protein V1774_00550 [Candidatus Eisenbacteria bacterium]